MPASVLVGRTGEDMPVGTTHIHCNFLQLRNAHTELFTLLPHTSAELIIDLYGKRTRY